MGWSSWKKVVELAKQHWVGLKEYIEWMGETYLREQMTVYSVRINAFVLEHYGAKTTCSQAKTSKRGTKIPAKTTIN